jgi:hypothetical protein
VIGIPSVRRQNNPRYLERTLKYILEQASTLRRSAASNVGGPHPLRLRLVVMDNSHGAPHPVFESARSHYCNTHGSGHSSDSSDTNVSVTVSGSSSACTVSPLPGDEAQQVASSLDSIVEFVVNGHAVFSGHDGGDPFGSANVPGPRVRQQTRDVADLLSAAVALHGVDGAVEPSERGDVYMFMEDDFRLCPSALAALAYLLAKAGHVHDGPDPLLGKPWNAIRVSFGLNGALIRMADAPLLAGYFRSHLTRRPPDHLTVEWFAGERPESAEHKRGRPHLAFRYNVLEHFGFASSLRDTESPLYAYCYDLLDAAVVFEVEAFNIKQCAHDDIWPCPPIGDARLVGEPKTDINFAGLARNARSNTVQSRDV